MPRLVAFLAFLASVAHLESAESSLRPNIVLFLVDDMGWMDSTPYGSQYYEIRRARIPLIRASRV